MTGVQTYALPIWNDTPYPPNLESDSEPEKSAEKSAKPGAAPASQTPPAVMKPQTVNPSASAVTNEGAEASSEENMPSVSQLDRGVWGGMPGVGGMEGMR